MDFAVSWSLGSLPPWSAPPPQRRQGRPACQAAETLDGVSWADLWAWRAPRPSAGGPPEDALAAAPSLWPASWPPHSLHRALSAVISSWLSSKSRPQLCQSSRLCPCDSSAFLLVAHLIPGVVWRLPWAPGSSVPVPFYWDISSLWHDSPQVLSWPTLSSSDWSLWTGMVVFRLVGPGSASEQATLPDQIWSVQGPPYQYVSRPAPPKLGCACR